MPIALNFGRGIFGGRPRALEIYSVTMLRDTANHPDWARLSGTILEGGYEVEELIEADDSRAKYGLRVLGDRSIDAFLNVFRADLPAAEEQIGIWQIARQLQHPNLSVPLTSGLLQTDGVLVYVGSRKPSETLSEVLRERALKESEAGEILLSISGALEYLHARGLVQGCISPEEILAVGDSIELSTESIRRVGARPSYGVKRTRYRAPESGDENITPEADAWCLGATLFEALTQKDCAEGCREQSAQLPGRFGLIVERCLDPNPQTRCTLREAVALYRQVQVSAAPQVAQKATPAVARSPEISPVKVKLQRPVSETRSGRTWVYAAVGLIVVLLLIWAARPKHTAPPSGIAATMPSKAASAGPGSAWETRTLARRSEFRQAIPSRGERQA